MPDLETRLLQAAYDYSHDRPLSALLREAADKVAKSPETVRQSRDMSSTGIKFGS